MALTSGESISIILSCFSVFMSIRAYWLAKQAHSINSKEHEWKAEDRSEAAARSTYCKEVPGHIKTSGSAVRIPLEKLDWAKWGESNRMFRVQELRDGWCATYWYEDEPGA